MAETPALEAAGLYKTFKGTDADIRVLRGVDLTVAPGEVVAIIGASGVGKSTLLQILGSLDHADEGKLIIHGHDVATMKPKALNEMRNKFIGFVFQFHFLLPEFTALENVTMPGLIGGRGWPASTERARELLDRVGLADRLEHRPNELSGGEQQRVAVARALANSPELVFADEPTGNLDEVSSGEVHEIVARLAREEKKTFVVVTHKMEFARYADRVLVLEDGQLRPAEASSGSPV